MCKCGEGKVPELQTMKRKRTSWAYASLGLTLIFTGCSRKGAPAESYLLPQEPTNPILSEIKDRIIYLTGRTNTTTNLLTDLESKLSKYDVKSKISNQLEVLKSQLSQLQEWDDFYAVVFYQKLKELSVEGNDSATNRPAQR